jgi:phage shock protein PspC (stress-responsive transcriptional regulator)
VRNAKIAGVCAGLARHFNIDPLVVRLIMLLSIFLLGPLVLCFYVACALMMPRSDLTGAENAQLRAQSMRFAGILFLMTVVLPCLYAAFVLPRVAWLYASSELELPTSARMAFVFAQHYIFWPYLLALILLLIVIPVGTLVYHIACNTTFRRVYARIVLWASILWLAFLLLATALPLLDLAQAVR